LGKRIVLAGPLRGIIWLTVAIAGFGAAIALLAGYVQKARSLEKDSEGSTTTFAKDLREIRS